MEEGLHMKQRILDEVDSLSKELIELCRQLVQINTVNPYSGDATASLEKDGQLFLESLLKDMGAHTRLFDPPLDIYQRMGVLGPRNRNFKDRPNLVGELDFGGPGRRIILNGHMDTVGAADMDFDPFAAEIKNGKIWGRGTSDCKGGLAVALTAIKALLPFRDELCGSIVYESVVDEECDGSGAGTLACIDAGYRGDAALFMDGKDTAITLGCYGCLTASIHVTGHSAHAASGKGVSAIEKALVVKRAIDQLKAERESLYPEAKVNLGVFRAGAVPALVPGSAYMSMNIVYKLEEAMAAEGVGEGYGAKGVQRRLTELIAHYEKEDEWLRKHKSRIEWVKDLIPFEIPQETEIVRRMAEVYKTMLRQAPVFDKIVGWSDASYYFRLAGMPTFLFGPGNEEAPHTPYEYVEIENLINACKVVAMFLYRELKKTDE